MKLIATKLGPSGKLDRLTFVRRDGTRTEIDMPRQGVLPHDLVHHVVEQGLRLRGGFLSLVAGGAEARFVMEAAHDPKRHEVAAEAIRAEALVEALQTQLWSGAFDHAAFSYGIGTAAEARSIDPPPAPDAEASQRLFDRAIALNAEWQRVPPHGALELEFDAGDQ